jgi:hypothetical protein
MQVGGFFGVFARQQADPPAAVVSGADHEGGWPRWLEILHAGARQHGQPGLVRPHVHHPPGLVEVQVFQADAELDAQLAAAAVAGNRPAGPRGISCTPGRRSLPYTFVPACPRKAAATAPVGP